MILLFETTVKCQFDKIRAGFNQELFITLRPPGVSLIIERFDGCSVGHEVHLNLNSFGVRQKWVSEITEEFQGHNEWYFVDEGRNIPWPLASWRHKHQVILVDEETSKIIDDITYECSPSWMSKLIYPILWLSFVVKPARYKKYFERL